VSDPEKALRRTLTIVKSLEPEFIGELIIESHLAQRDPSVTARLIEAASELRPLIADVYSEEPARAIARRAIGGGGGAGLECQACRDGACTPISCWVIVVVIVVVVVTK